MRMVGARQRPRTATRQTSRASLAVAAEILGMSRAELAQRVDEELAANPALEILPQQVCAICGSASRDEICGPCRLSLQARYRDYPFHSTALPAYPTRQDEEEVDPYGQLSTPVDLRSHLTLQARSGLPSEDQDIADYLIASIDDKGLLDSDPEEIAGALQVPLARVKAVLRGIQDFEPAGVGATGPREALLIQVRQLAEAGRADPWAERVIEEHWEPLARHAYAKIARTLGIGRDELDACLAFIQTNLNPYPGRQFYSPWQEDAGATGAPATPDVIIRRDLDEYRVELPAAVEGELRLSASYARLRRLIAGTPQRRLPPGWRAALESVRRARWFLSCIQMRDATLKQVCECLVAEQRGYLDTGQEESIRPLTQTRVAAAVGKHESTVSRAVAGKFALLPWGALVPLAKFFDSSAAPKGVIKELIEREDRSRPLTDSELSSLLHSRGYDLARRTVTKYRLALDIPSHARRRSLYARSANGRH